MIEALSAFQNIFTNAHRQTRWPILYLINQATTQLKAACKYLQAACVCFTGVIVCASTAGMAVFIYTDCIIYQRKRHDAHFKKHRSNKQTSRQHMHRQNQSIHKHAHDTVNTVFSINLCPICILMCHNNSCCHDRTYVQISGL